MPYGEDPHLEAALVAARVEIERLREEQDVFIRQINGLVETLAKVDAEVDKLQGWYRWKSIETAPKDGRDILVAYDCYVGWVHIVKWFNKKSGPQWVFSHDHKKLFEKPNRWMPVPSVHCGRDDCEYCR